MTLNISVERKRYQRMSKGLKGLAAIGFLGGAAFGGYKAYQKYLYLKETHNNVILFNGEKLIYDDVFQGDSVAAIAAGVEIDLREAEFDADFSNLDIYGVGAGFKIMVPDDIKVIVSGVNKASGIQVNVDEHIEGKVLNITYDLTGSGLLVASQNPIEDVDQDRNLEPETSLDEMVVEEEAIEDALNEQ